MHESNWIEYFLVLEILASAFTWKFFKAAGRPVWEAFLPVVRTYRLLQIAGRPLLKNPNSPQWKVVGLRAFWTLLFFVPVVGNVMAIILAYELLHVFNYRKISHALLAIFTLGLYVGYLNYTADLKYVGRDEKNIKSTIPESVSAIIFAVVAATFIRALTFEAYTIPTSSMEKSLMVGDFLFVSKMHYGSRIPMTPVSVPLVHNKMPFSATMNSFVDWIQFPYIRLPKLQDVERGESVVFNYPMEDQYPIDKRENYIKRCVGIPGDSLEIVNREIIINGSQRFILPDRANSQTNYYVKTNGVDFNSKALKLNYDINYLSQAEVQKFQDMGDVLRLSVDEYIMAVSSEAYPSFSKLGNIVTIAPLNATNEGDTIASEMLALYYNQIVGSGEQIFPNKVHHAGEVFPYTRDNYGPIWIPKQGATVALDETNWQFYERIITVYEGHDAHWENGQAIVDGTPASTYTFAQNYYWMMGDNRHNSLDSRYWGYVPEDHIVGKPVFIWMSYDKFGEGKNKIRWERIFTTVHGEGPRRSYFWHALVVGLLIYGFSVYRNKKRARA